MSLHSWLRSLRARIALSKTVRRGNVDAPRAIQLAEPLESRCLLAVTPILIDDTNLIVQLEAGDDVIIQAGSSGLLEVLSSGSVVFGNPDTILTADITSIIVNGGDGSNLIDLTGVTTADFAADLPITVNGGDGNDTILGSEFNDSLVGGNGADSIVGGLGDDSLEGNNGNDTISGGVDDDSILGGDGADVITGDVGNDTVIAGNGADNVSGGDGTDSLNGGDGSDTLNGDAGDDTLSGDSGNDSLLGGTDNDSISGGIGNDTASGGDGLDTINGGADNDSLNGDDGTDSIDGSDGNDALFGGNDNDTLNGGVGNDSALGNAGNDSVLGGTGNDFLVGGADDDTVRGNAGNDTIFGGTGSDLLFGDAGNDRIQSVGSSLSIANATTVTEGDSGVTSVNFTVTLAEASSQTITATFQTEDGSAIAGFDYVAKTGTLTFAPGQITATISIDVIGDTAGEGTEFFFVRIAPGTNAVIDNDLASADILDTDTRIVVDDASIPEGNSGTTTLSITVRLTTVSTTSVSVNYATANNDAIAGLDYVTASGTLTFAPGVMVQTFSVSIFTDNVGENSEQFFVNLSNPINATLADAQGIATIVDDDGGPITFGPITEETSLEPPNGVDGEPLIPEGASGFTFTDNLRWNNTATDGSGLTQGQATTLTWGLVPDGTSLDNGNASNLIARLDTIYNETASGPDVRNRTWFNLFVSVFDRFASFSGLSYIYEPNDDQAAFPNAGGVVGVRPDIRIGGRNIDGDFNILAFNYFPNAGDMVIDTNDVVYTITTNNSLILRNVLGHEHGHGIGFPHVMPVNNTKLMEPTLSVAFDGPQEDDILATNRGYGDRNEKNGGNDSAATATQLGLVTPTASAAVAQVSIDDDSDLDFFSFDVAQNVTADITITPTGTAYLSGVQGGAPPTIFNALAQVDLAFDLFDSDGTTLLASVNNTGLGLAEQLTGFNLSSGTYFVRVTGPQNMVQMYDLGLAVTATTPPPIGPTIELPDSLFGGDGNDTLLSAGGDDFLNGNAGNDSLVGGAGNDALLGGAGADTLDGDLGDDTVDGQGGNDRVAGGDGSDTYVWNGTGDGVDTLSSLSGYDKVRVQGSAVANNFVVSQANGQLRITDGSAVLNVSPIIQVVDIMAGDGDDTITIGALDRVRTATLLTVNGGDGNDTINSNGANIGLIRVSLIGGLGDDSLTGSAGIDSLDGGDGDDALDAQGGNDLVIAGLGDDTVLGGAGNDRIFAGDGSDNIDAGAGDDSVIGDVGADTIAGGDGNDTLDGGDGTDTIDGGAGNDSILGGNEADDLNGSTGNDTVRGGASDDTIIGENGNDKLYGDDGNDSILGYDGDDTINGGDGDDTLDGLNGNDLIGGGNGDDVMNGAAGNDTLTGGDGNDTIAGGAGRDVLLGDEGDDSLNGQGGFDTINPGEGSDTVFDPTNEIDTTFTLSAALLAALV